MTQKWIDIGDLALGMFIVKLGGAWMDHPFWKSHFLLANEEDLRLLQNAGLHRVCIDVNKGSDVSTATKKSAPVPEDKPQSARSEPSTAPTIIDAREDNQAHAVPIKEELRRAVRICA